LLHKENTNSSNGLGPRCYTFMLIPHSQRSVIRVRVPNSMIKVASLIVAIVIIITIIFTVNYFNMKNNMLELYRLREVNQEQKEQLNVLEQKTSALSGKMSELKDLESEIKKMLKLEEESKRTSSQVTAFSRVSRGNIERRIIIDEVDSSNGMGGSLETILGIMILPSGEILSTAEKFDKVDKIADEMDKQMTAMEITLKKLKKDIVKWKAYLAAKPSIWPVHGRITSGFGYRRSPFTGRREFHPAIDIGAPYGTPIRATGDGVVQYAGYKTGYGFTVIIRHGYGFKTVYGHNSKIKVRVGQKVKKGEVIALLGNSGRCTGPHLHYEVHVNGRFVNPVEYLQ